MPSSKRLVALAALAVLALASLAPSASADWCADQRARCLKRCGGKEADMDFDCRDKPGARSVSCSCSNGMSGFSGGDGGGGSSSFAGSGAGASAGTGLGGGSGSVFGGGLSPDQVARDGFSNVARVARGENPFFFGGDGEGGGAGGSGTKQQQPGSSDATTSGSDAARGPLPATISSSSQSTTPSWAVALAVIASLVAATCAGALGFVVMRRNHEKKVAAIATPSLPLYDYDASKPSAQSPTKTGHAL